MAAEQLVSTIYEVSGPFPPAGSYPISTLPEGWAGLLGQIPFEVLFHLTFDDEKVNPLTKRRAVRSMCRWSSQVCEMYRSPVGIAVAVERSQGGRWHGHSLLVGLRTRNPRVAQMLWEERNGRALWQSVYDAVGAARYLSKGTATTTDIILNEHLVRYSGGNARSRS